MKKGLIACVLGFVIGIIILPLCGFLYVWTGHFPVATAGPPLPLEKWLASTSLRARITREAPRESPIPASEENLLAGARLYQENCAVCHGTRNQPKTAIAKGMYPPPPQLLEGKGVTDDPVGETYWKAANGIRLTGMPGFKDSLSNTQLWQVSQLLANADHVPAAVNQFLVSQPPPR